MRHPASLFACCFLLLATAQARQLRQAAAPCPYATDTLSCVRPGYAVPADLTAQFLRRIPQLTVGGFADGDRRLLDLLPLPEMTRLLHSRLPYAASQCTLPALPTATVLSHATNPASPLYPTLAACRTAPVLADKNYVWGAVGPNLPVTTAVAGQPAMRRFRSAFAPQLSMCAALNPCNNNLFVGIDRMERPVRLSLSGFRSEMRLTSMMYSHLGAGMPPAWRAGPTPTFWQLERPDVPTTLGRLLPLPALAPPAGRLLLGGSMRGGAGASVAVLDGLIADLGQQSVAWLLWRDEANPAVSARLASAPDLAAWGALALPLHSMPALQNLDLLVKPHTSELWLSTSAPVAVPLANLARLVPPVGAVLGRLLADPSAAQGALASLDASYHPARGLSLRLRFSAGAYQLTADGKAATAGPEVLTEPWGLVLHANRNAPRFTRVTLELGGTAFPFPYDV